MLKCLNSDIWSVPAETPLMAFTLHARKAALHAPEAARLQRNRLEVLPQAHRLEHLLDLVRELLDAEPQAQVQEPRPSDVPRQNASSSSCPRSSVPRRTAAAWSRACTPSAARSPPFSTCRTQRNLSTRESRAASRAASRPTRESRAASPDASRPESRAASGAASRPAYLLSLVIPPPLVSICKYAPQTPHTWHTILGNEPPSFFGMIRSSGVDMKHSGSGSVRARGDVTTAEIEL